MNLSDGQSFTAPDLLDPLQLRSKDGHIWLNEQRMILLHAGAMGSLRKELVDTLGLKRTRGLLTRMGYAAGVRDAETVRKAMPEHSVYEWLKMGPKLRALEGVVNVNLVKLEADIAQQHYYCEVIWQSSFECQIHQEVLGLSSEPVCWSQIGYACGYATTLIGGVSILFKEVECKGQGDARCHIIGKPAQAWEDQEDVAREMQYFKPEPFSEQMVQLQDQLEQLRSSLMENVTLGDMVGTSPAFRNACELIRKAAVSQVTVLLLGETGVGKEMFARGLHSVSARANGPFVAVNCAALPEDLIESELFGVEKGAFTGAHTSRPGRFERAHGGTLFLDEIGELSLMAQAKLLRALQEGEVERVGDTRTRKVDVRVVAATLVDLQEAVKAGRFRSDLYYRLNIFPVRIPPLRERKDDIPLLVERFLGKHSVRHGRRIEGISEQALGALRAYNWPGNIRELENIIERGVILAPSDGKIELTALFPSSYNEPTDTEETDFLLKRVEEGTTLEQLEDRLLKATVERCDGNLSSAARMLGLTRRQLEYRLKGK